MGILENENSLWLWLILILIGIAFWVLRHKCPMCRRFLAMERTGREEKKPLEVDLEEWKCKYCGYQTWEKKSSDNGVG